MSRLVLAGAGGLGREVYSWARATVGPDGPWAAIVFIDDRPDALEATRFPARRIASIADYEPEDGDCVTITVGMPRAKTHLFGLLVERGARLHTLTHPTAMIGIGSEIGEGSIVSAGCIVTADARIGRCVTLNVYATVGHDAVVGDFSTLGGHADVTGGAHLETAVFLGSHAVVAPGVRVREGATVGAGTVAFRTVAAGSTVIGVPGLRLGGGTDTTTRRP